MFNKFFKKENAKMEDTTPIKQYRLINENGQLVRTGNENSYEAMVVTARNLLNRGIHTTIQLVETWKENGFDKMDILSNCNF